MKRAIFGLFLLAFFLFLGACDISYGGGEHDDRRPLQTRILEVLIEPDPIKVGETATFTAIIEDSLDTRFQYTWHIVGITETQEKNQIEWIADIDPGRHLFVVTADNGDTRADYPRLRFYVNVVP